MGGYKYYRLKREEDIPFFQKKRNIVLREPVPDLFFLQYNRGMGSFMEFALYDAVVRYMAIEDYYGNNPMGFALYNKMNEKAGDGIPIAQDNKKDDVFPIEVHTKESFSKLIQSIEEKGYDEKSPIIFDRKGQLMNGSHRFAVALYRRQDFITVDFRKRMHSRRWIKEWFWANDFSPEEMKLIEKKKQTVYDQCRERIGSFFYIIFPTGKEYFEEITNCFNEMDPDNLRVERVRDYHVEWLDFAGIIRAMYATDNIDVKTLNEKLLWIKESLDDSRIVSYRIIEVSIKNMDYRLKPENGMPQAYSAIRYKKAIRERYGKRIYKNPYTKVSYNHDILIHGTDNSISNNTYRILSGLECDISELFQKLENYNYAVIMTGDDELSRNFPKNYFLGKDIDIFVYEEQIDDISNIAYEYLKNKYIDIDWIEIEKKLTEHGVAICVYLMDNMLFGLDFLCRLFYLKKESARGIIDESEVRSGVKVVNNNNEFIIRLAQITINQKKSHHARWIVENREFSNRIDFEKYTEPGLVRKRLNEILQSE